MIESSNVAGIDVDQNSNKSFIGYFASNMSEEEEIAKKIGELGEQIKQAKADKKPKEEWDPILKEMLALKVSKSALCFVTKRNCNLTLLALL